MAADTARGNVPAIKPVFEKMQAASKGCSQQNPFYNSSKNISKCRHIRGNSSGLFIALIRSFHLSFSILGLYQH